MAQRKPSFNAVKQTIKVLKSEFVCCDAADYEAGCISCEALRIVHVLQGMLDDGTYGLSPRETAWFELKKRNAAIAATKGE